MIIFGENLKLKIIMKDIWKKLMELYDAHPTLFGILLFLDLAILYFVIQWLIS